MEDTYTKVRIREGNGMTIDCLMGEGWLRCLQAGIDARQSKMFVKDIYGNLLPICPQNVTAIERRSATT